MKSQFLNYLLIAILSVGAISCKKDKEEEKETPTPSPTPVETVQKLKLEVKHKMGENDFDYNTILEDSNGTKFKLDHVSMYFSELAPGGVEVKGAHLLISPTVENYTVGNIEARNYPGIRIGLGVQESVNTQAGDDAKEITEYPDGHALSFQNPSMYWSWNSGYIFFRVDGKYDSNGDGVPNETLALHVGHNANYQIMHFPGSFSVNTSTDKILNFEIDYVKFFDGLDILTENTLHGNAGLAQKITANYSKAIKRNAN